MADIERVKKRIALDGKDDRKKSKLSEIEQIISRLESNKLMLSLEPRPNHTAIRNIQKLIDYFENRKK